MFQWANSYKYLYHSVCYLLFTYLDIKKTYVSCNELWSKYRNKNQGEPCKTHAGHVFLYLVFFFVIFNEICRLLLGLLVMSVNVLRQNSYIDLVNIQDWLRINKQAKFTLPQIYTGIISSIFKGKLNENGELVLPVLEDSFWYCGDNF